VHIGEPSLFRLCELEKINTSSIPLLFKPFIKFYIAYSPPLGDICVFQPDLGLADLGHATSIWELPAGYINSSARGAHGAVTLSSAHVASFCGGGCVNLLRRCHEADDDVGACLSALKNKGGGPRVPTCAKMKICRFSAPNNLAGVS
jgi:hypothetical protein